MICLNGNALPEGSLLMPQSIDRVQPSRLHRRNCSEEQTDDKGEDNGRRHDIPADKDRNAGHPGNRIGKADPDQDSQNAADQGQHAGFGQELR